MARIRSFRNRIQEYETLHLISLIPLLDDIWCFQQCITKERTVQGVLGVPHGPRKEAQPGSKFGCDFKMELIMLACCLLRDEIAHSCLQLFGNSGFCYVPQGPLLILNLGRTPLVWAALILYGRSIGTDGEGSIPRRLPRIYRKAL